MIVILWGNLHHHWSGKTQCQAAHLPVRGRGSGWGCNCQRGGQRRSQSSSLGTTKIMLSSTLEYALNEKVNTSFESNTISTLVKLVCAVAPLVGSTMLDSSTVKGLAKGSSWSTRLELHHLTMQTPNNYRDALCATWYKVLFHNSFRPVMTILKKSPTHKWRTLFLLKRKQSCFLRFNLLLRYKELKNLSISTFVKILYLGIDWYGWHRCWNIQNSLSTCQRKNSAVKHSTCTHCCVCSRVQFDYQKNVASFSWITTFVQDQLLFKHLYHVAKKYDNHKQALTETAARECQCV